MNDLSPTDVLIIGAGPAGLALGRALKFRGLRVKILERDRIGSTWQIVPDELRVLSPWWTNVLDMRDVVHCNPFKRVMAYKFKRHLLRFASKADLDVLEGKEVYSLMKTDHGWKALTRDEREWPAAQIVCATGYFSAPREPAAPFVSDGTVPTFHASEITDYDAFARRVEGKKVILVGKRVTAGQILIEMCRRDVDITLAARSPVQYRRSGMKGEFLDQIYFCYETLRVLIQPTLQANSYPVMDGGEAERLILSGRVQVLPRLAGIIDGQVLLEDGSTTRADIVVYATGYQPALSYLSGVCDLDPDSGLPKTHDFEIVQAPGVFVLGFDNLRNFRSRYLRGIRSDAKLLADIISARHSEH